MTRYSSDKQQKSKINLIDGALILTLVSSYLYCASTASVQGYLIRLHLDSDLLDRNFHQILYHGMLKSLLPLAFILSLYLVYVFFDGVLKIWLSNTIRESFKSGRKWAWRRRKIAKFMGQRQRPRKETNVERLYAGKVKRASILFFTMLAFVVSMANIETSGIQDAELVKDGIKNNTLSTIEVKINGKLTVLFPLYWGVRNCAGYDAKRKTIEYFPQNGHSLNINSKSGFLSPTN